MIERRLINRLPEHYRAYEEGSLLNSIMSMIGREMDKVEDAVNSLRRSRWIDFADIKDLENLGKFLDIQLNPGETLEEFRTRLKGSVKELMEGVGTVESLSKFIETSIGIRPEIIENPKSLKISDERIVSSGEGWIEENRSMTGANPTIFINSLNDTSNPSIINVTTQESVTFHGILKKGEYLVIYPDCKSLLSGENVSNRIRSTTGKTPTLPIGISEWRYVDSSVTLGYSKFDSATFSSEKICIQLVWETSEPATFIVKFPIKEIKRDIRGIIDNVKPAGIVAKVNYWDKFYEIQQPQKDYIIPTFNVANKETQLSGTELFSMSTKYVFCEKMVIEDKLVVCDKFGTGRFNQSAFG